MITTIDSRYKASSFIQVVKEGDNAVIWHSLFGNPQIVSTDTLILFDRLSEPLTLREAFGESLHGDNLKAINELIEYNFIISDNFSERSLLANIAKEREYEITNGSLIDYLELIMSEACNFRCSYCIHFNNLGSTGHVKQLAKLMNFRVAKEAVDNYIAILKKHKKVVAEINFGGGEPLLNWPTIKKILEYCYVVYGLEFEFRFSINTNASLITPEIATALKEYGVEVASSLDGLRDGNDSVRLTKTGSGTFSLIMKGFDNLKNADYPLDGISVTITDKNFNQLNESIVDWAKLHKMNQVMIDIDVVGMVNVPTEIIVEKLMHIRHYALERGVDVSGFWARPTENLNESTIKSHVSFCGAARGNSMCVDYLGQIYACGYSTVKLGSLSNIHNFFKPNSVYSNFVKSRLTGSISMCKGCMIEGQCAGGCIITQEYAKKTQIGKVERMCKFYRRMTQEIILEQLREAMG